MEIAGGVEKLKMSSCVETEASSSSALVVPVCGFRFRSYALDEAKWTPWVQVVPRVMTVSCKISRSICKLPCRMFGTRKWGSTSEILEAENCEGSVGPFHRALSQKHWGFAPFLSARFWKIP